MGVERSHGRQRRRDGFWIDAPQLQLRCGVACQSADVSSTLRAHARKCRPISCVDECHLSMRVRSGDRERVRYTEPETYQ